MVTELNGQTLAGRYRFEATVGEGTFAKVFRVHDTRRSVDLAAKVLRTDIAHEHNFVQRFRREGEVLARLQHPNIVRYYDLVEADGFVFILMEYVPGQTLQSTLYRLGEPLSPRTALEFLRPLSAALHFAHGEGIIHRDLKPANVLIHENGNLLVTDFGIARLLDDAALSLTGGRVLGTPLYMAPEQISGHEVTPASDIYALGVLLYQMMTTHVPFDGNHPQAKGETVSERVTYEHLNIPPMPLRQVVPEVDEAVDVIVMQCLAKDPLRRPKTVRGVYDALAEAVGKVPFDLAGAAVSESDSQPPDIKLPEVSQFDLVVHGAPVEADDSSPDDDTEEVPIQDPADHADVTMPSAPNYHKADVTLRSKPYNPARRRSDVPIVQAPAPSPAAQSGYAQPGYEDVFYDDSIGFDPMRFLLIGVAIAVFACVALVFYTIDPFGSDDGDDSPALIDVEDTSTEDGTDSGVRPTATRLPTPIANDDVSLLGPPGSSDGSLVLYASRRTGILQLYSIRPDGSGLRQVLDVPDLQMTGPSWSPDGREIAFYGWSGSGINPADIFVMNTDGTDLVNITNSETYNDRYVTWSPDGRYLVFHSNRPGQDGSQDYELYRYDLLTEELTQLTFNGLSDFGPDYAPDGNKIAFFSYIVDRAAIYTINADGSGRTQVSPDSIETSALYPTWSPDGSQIAFHVEMSPNVYQVFLMNADGTNVRPMMPTFVNDQFPDWSPDGQYIIFQRVEDDVPTVYSYSLEEGTLTQVSTGLGDFLPEWQPIY